MNRQNAMKSSTLQERHGILYNSSTRINSQSTEFHKTFTIICLLGMMFHAINALNCEYKYQWGLKYCIFLKPSQKLCFIPWTLLILNILPQSETNLALTLLAQFVHLIHTYLSCRSRILTGWNPGWVNLKLYWLNVNICFVC